MNVVIHQNIVIQNLHIRTVSNASVLQIGSTGSISGLARIANTGGFAHGAVPPEGPMEEAPSYVPLPSTTR